MLAEGGYPPTIDGAIGAYNAVIGPHDYALLQNLDNVMKKGADDTKNTVNNFK